MMWHHIWEFLRWFWPPWLILQPSHSDVTNGLFILKVWVNAYLIVLVYIPFVTLTLYAFLRDRKDCPNLTLADLYNRENYKRYPDMLCEIGCLLCVWLGMVIHKFIQGCIWLRDYIGKMPIP